MQVMRVLLGPSGCAWDRAQSASSLAPYLLEETYEVLDAIDQGDPRSLCEELGDLLFQVVFQTELAAQEGRFVMRDVIGGIHDKLVRRHPHVFADVDAKDVDAAIRSWEQAKAEERRGRDPLEGVPKQLPALLRAVRVEEKLRAVADARWTLTPAQRAARIPESLATFMPEASASADESAEAIEARAGELLLDTALLVASRGIDPESALRKALERWSATAQNAAPGPQARSS